MDTIRTIMITSYRNNWCLQINNYFCSTSFNKSTASVGGIARSYKSPAIITASGFLLQQPVQTDAIQSFGLQSYTRHEQAYLNANPLYEITSYFSTPFNLLILVKRVDSLL